MVQFLEDFIQVKEPDKKLMMERLCLGQRGIRTHPERVRPWSGISGGFAESYSKIHSI